MHKSIASYEYSSDYYLSPAHDFHDLGNYHSFLKGGGPPRIFIEVLKKVSVKSGQIFLLLFGGWLILSCLNLLHLLSG